MSRLITRATVACVIEREGRFLLVREQINGQLRLNQPAGHLEADESLQQAALRETLEETGWDVELTGVVGVNLYKAAGSGSTFLRTTFIARALRHHPERPLDEGIVGPVWLTRQQVAACRDSHRSPMVLGVIDDYLAGRRFALEVVAADG